MFEDHLSGGSRSSEEVIVTEKGYVAGGGEAEATWMEWGGAVRHPGPSEKAEVSELANGEP